MSLPQVPQLPCPFLNLLTQVSVNVTENNDGGRQNLGAEVRIATVECKTIWVVKQAIGWWTSS